MGKGMQCVQNGPKDLMDNRDGWLIDKPGQVKESFGAGTSINEVR